MGPAKDDALDLDSQLCFALHAASRRVVRAYTTALAPFGLTYPQYLVLLVLWQWDRESFATPTITALGQRLELDSDTLPPLVRRMIAHGLLRKARQADDERQVFVTLTSAGKALRDKVRAVPLEMRKRLPLSAGEFTRLRRQLQSLAT